jgi:hypothetical protein
VVGLIVVALLVVYALRLLIPDAPVLATESSINPKELT